MEKFEELVDYLSMLADKYAFSEKEMKDLQDIIEDIYDGEDEDATYEDNVEESTDQEPTDEWGNHHSVAYWNKRLVGNTYEETYRHIRVAQKMT